jgi:hypothetical protein
MEDGFQEVVDHVTGSQAGPSERGFERPVLRCCKYVRATRPEDSVNFGNRSRGVKDVLEDILGDEQVERVVDKREVFDTLAPNALPDPTSRQIVEILRGGVTERVASEKVV